MCASALVVDDANYAQHNYPSASANHGYGLCGRHGSDSTNGVFASRWGMTDDVSGAVYGPQMRLQNVIDGMSNTIAFSEFAKGQDYILPTSYKNLMGRSWFDPAVNYGNIGFSTRTDATPNNPKATYSTTVNFVVRLLILEQ